MRRIGQISDESSARRFSDYLYVKGIENRIETSDGEMWNVWVHDEHQLIQAKRLLAEFQNNPNDAKYRNARETAQQQRKQEREDFKAYQKRFLTTDKIFPGGISRHRQTPFRLLPGLGRFLLCTVRGHLVRQYPGSDQLHHRTDHDGTLAVTGLVRFYLRLYISLFDSAEQKD